VNAAKDEGVTIPDLLAREIHQLDPIADAWNESTIWALYDQLDNLERPVSSINSHPNDLTSIRLLRPQGPRDLKWSPTEGELLDGFHGAWLGRTTGCALGLPVEQVGVLATERTYLGRETIRERLNSSQDWPLSDFFVASTESASTWGSNSLRPNISYMEPDDDIHYSIAGLCIMETYGPGFSWTDVSDWWISHFPLSALCTAEAQAILNYASRTARWGSDGGARSSATAEFCRRYRNPYREWIGAQIRSDPWAWVAAGNPELAAEFAFRDASWTHTANGIYGSMFFAALQSAAFVIKDPHELIQIALSEIPEECDLALAIRETVAFCATANDWESAMEKLEQYVYGLSEHLMNPVHTINNACVCIVALLFSSGEPISAMSIAVMAGLDTDCNGATVGAISGALAGGSKFNNSLSAKLNNRIVTRIPGMQDLLISDLAQRTVKQWNVVRRFPSATNSY
jgi:ADP-ribosylglycohydrolase